MIIGNYQAEAGAEEFPEHLGQEINHSRNSHTSDKKSPQSKRSGSNLLHGIFISTSLPWSFGIGGWGQDAKSYPLISYIYSMSYWPLEGAFWVDLLPPTQREGQLEASLNLEELNAVP